MRFVQQTLAAVLFVVVFSATSAFAVDHAIWDKILHEVVRNERVDYQKIKTDFSPALAQYLDQLAGADVSAMDRNTRLAYYINLYNATMVKAVIDRDPSRFKPSDDDFAVFKAPIVRMAGKTITLNDLENEIVRKEFNDPRIHAALVCAALSCPPILDRAYRADDLDSVLDANIKRWLSDPKRNEIDEAGRKLKLSRLFDWYNADFGGKDNVPGFVSKTVGKDLSGFAVEFKEYDWTLNRAD